MMSWEETLPPSECFWCGETSAFHWIEGRFWCNRRGQDAAPEDQKRYCNGPTCAFVPEEDDEQ